LISSLKMDWTEVMHILVSVVTIALAFSLFRAGVVFSFDYFLAILLTVGSAFILHELAHKYVALHYGVHAAYRAWTTGLFLALVMAFVTQGAFVFAAPGAVYIFGQVNRRQSGRIALAGPLMNLVLAITFLALSFILTGAQSLLLLGAYINAFIGGFNTIPFAPLDGEKIARWDQRAWGALFVSFVLLFLFIGGF